MRSPPVSGVWINWNTILKPTSEKTQIVQFILFCYCLLIIFLSSNYITPVNQYISGWMNYGDLNFKKARPSEIQNFTKCWSKTYALAGLMTAARNRHHIHIGYVK